MPTWAGETFYQVDGRPKSVLFWNVIAEPGPVGAVDPHEVAATEWLPVGDALARLSYVDERDLVARNSS